jgi:ABC-type nitrate/sulfonate/bicarbonate transport system ATPase subunit
MIACAGGAVASHRPVEELVQARISTLDPRSRILVGLSSCGKSTALRLLRASIVELGLPPSQAPPT